MKHENVSADTLQLILEHKQRLGNSIYTEEEAFLRLLGKYCRICGIELGEGAYNLEYLCDWCEISADI